MRAFYLAALVAVPCGAATPIRKLRTAAQTRAAAEALECRLQKLERLSAEIPAPSIADELEATTGGAAAMEALSRVKTQTKAAHEARAPIQLEMALLSRRLEAYRETGDLPDTVADAAALKSLIDDPWGEKTRSSGDSEDCLVLARCHATEHLALGLPELIKQLDRFRPPHQRLVATRAAAHRKGPGQRVLAAVPAAAPSTRAARKVAPRIDLVKEMVAWLGSSEARKRALAADALGDMGRTATVAVPALRRALSDPDPRVRASAARALGAVATPTAPEIVADLQRALLDPSEDVRLSSRTALGRLAFAP